jgi:hypothetical protein
MPRRWPSANDPSRVCEGAGRCRIRGGVERLGEVSEVSPDYRLTIRETDEGTEYGFYV